MDSKKISSLKIILIGNLMVNLPITIVMIGLIFIILSLFGNQAMVPAVLISTFCGWQLWGKLLEKWRVWGENNKIEPERMYRLGKIGLINFYKYRIVKE